MIYQGFHYCGELRQGQDFRKIVDTLTGGAVDFAHFDECPVRAGFYDELVFTGKGDGGEPIEGFPVPAAIGPDRWFDAMKAQFPHERAGLDAYKRDMEAAKALYLPFLVWRSLGFDPPWTTKA